VAAAKIPHPVHLHCNNLGLPGNVETALATIAAAEGRRLHLTHFQFYSYGATPKGGLTSAGAVVAEAVNANKNITIDVGQVMFGPTVTISSDVPRQFAARGTAHPKKWIIADLEANGYGIVPHEYKERSKVSALQWAIGLELFLLVNDPWRVFFTTDHPNGAHFTTYPKIMHLLMDVNERGRFMERMPKSAFTTTTLSGIKREYSLFEIAIMTRASPARLFGLSDRGHLGPGAIADIAIYTPDRDISKMFATASLVFKNGVPIIQDGIPKVRYYGRTQTVRPRFDARIEGRLSKFYEDTFGAPIGLFDVPAQLGSDAKIFEEHPCSAS
jgi:formylmethanofuran dehydrogenase subunit A